MLALADIEAAAERIRGRVLRTPTIRSDALSRASGAEVFLKLENLQVTGSFKERGAANRLALLDAEECRRGVIAMSAGNHAQAVARHAGLLGIAATIVMPQHAPATKVTRTEAWGARVVLHGATLAESAAHARLLAAAEGLVFVHPYDDAGVAAGQGTLALEMLADIEGLDALLIPVGGGGMLAGCAAAARALRPTIAVHGVEVAAFASLATAVAEGDLDALPGGPTIADGIAVAKIGAFPLGVIRACADETLVVPEQRIEQAIALLIEGGKVVAEGAGATGVAGLLHHAARFEGRRVGIPICGGNIDARILANVLMRNLLRDGRLLRLRLDIPDHPGVLADIATSIGVVGGNIIDVSHHRLFSAPSVQAAELELMIEARDGDHGAAITAALERHYVVRRI